MQFWIKKVFFTQKFVLSTGPIKNTLQNVGYFFVECIFFFTQQPLFLLSDKKIHMYLFQMKYLYEIVFVSEGFVYDIYYFVTHFFYTMFSIFCFPLIKDIVKLPFQLTHETGINHFVIFKKYFFLFPVIRNKIHKYIKGLVLRYWYLKGNMYMLFLSEHLLNSKKTPSF